MRFAIQHIEPARDLAEAEEMVNGLRDQQGLIGVRILPKRGEPGWQWFEPWRVQAFYEPENIRRGDLLPLGCTHVVLPIGLVQALTNAT